jgi:type IV pilus assembly protein PilV
MRKRYSGSQAGSVLIETLVALLLFAFGVVSMVALQAASVGFAGQAKSRSDAAFLAEQIVGQMWADKRSNLSSYAHNASGALCNFTGSASANTSVTSWLGNATKPGSVFHSLPGASASYYQILVGTDKKVQVTLCWKSSADTAPRNFVLATQIDGGY